VIFRTCVWIAQLAHSQKQKEKETKEKNENIINKEAPVVFSAPWRIFHQHQWGAPPFPNGKSPPTFPGFFSSHLHLAIFPPIGRCFTGTIG